MQYFLGNGNDSKAFYNYLLKPTSLVKLTGHKLHDYMPRVISLKGK